MKRLFALIIVMGLFLCACGDTASVEMSVIAESVSQNGLQYKLTVEGRGSLANDPDDYYLEQNIGGAWQRVNGGSAAVGEAEIIEEDSDLIFTLHWTARYGELPGGLYKLNKIVTINGEDVKLTADFQIVTGSVE